MTSSYMEGPKKSTTSICLKSCAGYRREGLTLNKVKCKFSQQQVPFLGQVIDESGIKPDPSKVAAIRNVPVPTNVGDIRRYLGYCKPDEQVCSQSGRVKGNQWVWGEAQLRVFGEVKRMLTTTPVLALFDPMFNTILFS